MMLPDVATGIVALPNVIEPPAGADIVVAPSVIVLPLRYKSLNLFVLEPKS